MIAGDFNFVLFLCVFLNVFFCLKFGKLLLFLKKGRLMAQPKGTKRKGPTKKAPQKRPWKKPGASRISSSKSIFEVWKKRLLHGASLKGTWCGQLGPPPTDGTFILVSWCREILCAFSFLESACCFAVFFCFSVYSRNWKEKPTDDLPVTPKYWFLIAGHGALHWLHWSSSFDPLNFLTNVKEDLSSPITSNFIQFPWSLNSVVCSHLLVGECSPVRLYISEEFRSLFQSKKGDS